SPLIQSDARVDADTKTKSRRRGALSAAAPHRAARSDGYVRYRTPTIADHDPRTSICSSSCVGVFRGRRIEISKPPSGWLRALTTPPITLAARKLSVIPKPTPDL